MTIARLLGCAAIVVLGGVVHAGCDDRGHRFTCACTFLTDFDDGARRDVVVCAPAADRASNIARGCAQSAAPAPVQGCVCQPEAGADCALGECAQVSP